MQQGSSLQAVLFDFDGTILNSFPSQYQAYMATFAKYDIPMTDERFFEIYVPHWYDVYRAAGLAEELWDEADVFWLAEAARQAPALFPEATTLLAELAQDYALGIVSSGSRPRVLGDLERTGIAPLFEVVVAGEDVTEPKPAPEGVLTACERLNVAPSAAVYVGDTKEDCATARAAGMHFIGVVSEFSGQNPPKDCFHLESLAELVAVLDGLKADSQPDGER